MTPKKNPTSSERRTGFAGRLRNYLLTGLLALAPSVVTLVIFIRLLNWVDNLLGRYLRFEFFDYRRIPGAGLVATLLLLVVVGWLTTRLGNWIGGRSVMAMWDALLTRIPGVGILYGSTKSIGEAFFTERRGTFKQVVLVQWPHPGLWRLGFVAGHPGPGVTEAVGEPAEAVFVPHTPNPASGFVHYAPRSALVFLDWSVEDALRVIVSGGVVQPETAPSPPPPGPDAPRPA